MKVTLGVVAWCLVLGAVRPLPAESSDTAAEAARGLLARLLPDAVDRFALESIPADEGRDVFEVETRDGKVLIRGNNGVSMATGLNWYLKHRCQADVSWCGSQVTLPAELPEVKPKVRQVCWARHRYFLNYCCFGYSLPWWDWPQWERLIDWMALNGVNMPLAVTGQEAVWQAVGRRLGLTDRQIDDFLAGPPYLPFGWMGCLDGWGGPVPQNWIDAHVELQKKILARQRQLGMTPVLQGFTGHVPAAVGEKFPDAKLHRIHWIEWDTHLLDPLDPLFAKVAGLFMEEQTRRFGSDHFYAADTFIEMVPPSGELDYLDHLARAIYYGMARTDPQSVWVLQGWAFMNKRRSGRSPHPGVSRRRTPRADGRARPVLRIDAHVVADRGLLRQALAVVQRAELRLHRAPGRGHGPEQPRPDGGPPAPGPRATRGAGLRERRARLQPGRLRPDVRDGLAPAAGRPAPLDTRVQHAPLRPREPRRRGGVGDPAGHGLHRAASHALDHRPRPLAGPVWRRPLRQPATGRRVATLAPGRRRTGPGRDVPLRPGQRRPTGPLQPCRPAARRGGGRLPRKGPRAIQNGKSEVPATDSRPGRVAGHARGVPAGPIAWPTPGGGARTMPSGRSSSGTPDAC